MGFVYQIGGDTPNGYANAAQAIVRDWQLNGVFGAFSGNPYTMTGSGTLVNTPSNQQTADLVGAYNITDKIGLGRRVVRHDAIRATVRRQVRQYGS